MAHCPRGDQCRVGSLITGAGGDTVQQIFGHGQGDLGTLSMFTGHTELCGAVTHWREGMACRGT